MRGTLSILGIMYWIEGCNSDRTFLRIDTSHTRQTDARNWQIFYRWSEEDRLYNSYTQVILGLDCNMTMIVLYLNNVYKQMIKDKRLLDINIKKNLFCQSIYQFAETGSLKNRYQARAGHCLRQNNILLFPNGWYINICCCDFMRLRQAKLNLTVWLSCIHEHTCNHNDRCKSICVLESVITITFLQLCVWYTNWMFNAVAMDLAIVYRMFVSDVPIAFSLLCNESINRV